MIFNKSKLRDFTLTLALIILAGFGSVMLSHWATESIPFSKKAWSDRADWGDRRPIAKGFTETGLLRGKTEAEVKQLLEFNSKLGDHEDEEYDAQGVKTLNFAASGRLRLARLFVYIKNGRVLREELQEF